MLIKTKWKCLKNQRVAFLELLTWTLILGIGNFHKFKMFKTRFEGSRILFEYCLNWMILGSVATLLWEECEDETHTPKMGTWEFAGTPKTSEFDCRGQNTSHCGVLYIIGKLSKRRCWKWARMNHLDICSTSYGKKKGWESNWQFDSRPLKVGNQPNPGACRWSATCRWKALDKSYKFSLDLIPIGGFSKELWLCKVARVQTRIVSRLLLGSLGIKSHSDAGAMERRRE